MSEIKKYIEDYYLQNRQSPSTTKIAEAVGSARGTAYKYLVEMAEKNMIEYDGQEIRTNAVSYTHLETIRLLTPECDKLDYILSASSGALCGIIDVFLVGKPGESPLGDIDVYKRQGQRFCLLTT